MTPGNMPAAEVDVDVTLVRQLLEDQHPDLARMDVVEVASGWDNVIFRLGPDLSVRMPRRHMAAALVENEQRWLPEIAAGLPIPVPAPVRVGLPAFGYPWRWSVCPWFGGDIAAQAPALDLERAARDLGRFLAALHREAPAEAPASPYRGGPLADREPAFLDFTDGLRGTHDVDEIRSLWTGAVHAPRWPRPPVWVHGDLHPANILVEAGSVSAIIDFGDLNAGDPATDLAVAWMLFPRGPRGAFRDAAGGTDDDTWRRAHGWALYLGVAIVTHSADNPLFAEMGARILASVLADPPG